MNERGKTPRVVTITRPTEYQLLLERHGTAGQAKFFLKTRNQSIDVVVARHEQQLAAVEKVLSQVPLDWRQAKVDRGDLDRFLFDPDDIVVAIGQDGLVANAAKYLPNLPVVGVNPDPEEYEGVLVTFAPKQAWQALTLVAEGMASIEKRTMVRVTVDRGHSLLALNEVFIGQQTHQSARYRVRYDGREERQSSSGVIVATGTGSTGWARSICRERSDAPSLPTPCDPWLQYFVREAFPSVSTGCTLDVGVVEEGAPLTLISEMDTGVIFGDGIEQDFIKFGWGSHAVIEPAAERLHLVKPTFS